METSRGGRESMEISAEDLEDLHYAKGLLENPSLAAKLINFLGIPIEKAFGFLPARWSDAVSRATRGALATALHVAVATLDERGFRRTSDIVHKILVTATGAGGGTFGLVGLPVELPVSTTIMLRSIADIARSQGERIKLPEPRLACLEVFALGGRATSDDAAEMGYFAVRAVLARAVSEAAQFIAERGLVQESAPLLVRFITQVASRFGVAVSEKVAAQAVPILGAAGGAVINLLFIDHFQDMARGHFIVRRLERSYGPEVVRAGYERL
jgi:predicted outer membrane lipoprotein